MTGLLRRHPKALPFLFLTEMWERFGFYVVQGMLILYMTQAYGFSDDKSYTILGVFSALAYIAPMIGGLIADRLLGFKVSIICGGIFLSTGYGLLVLPGMENFYLALSTIIVGNGLFKPNISSLLGALYKPGDTARDTGFTLFYIGINLGVLLAGVFSGTIKDHYGWHAGFALASIGLLIGLLTFLCGVKWGNMTYHPDLSLAKRFKFLRLPWILAYCFGSIFLLRYMLESETCGKWLLPIIGIALIIFVFSLACRQTPEYRKNLITLNILIMSAVVFWMFMLQIFFSTNLFVDRIVDRTIFGIHAPTTFFYSLEAIFIVLLGPLFAWSWQTLHHSNRNPAPFSKFIVAIALVGSAFLSLAISTYFASAGSHLISPFWIVLAYLLITMGELFLSPIGLSAVTQLSPPHLTGMMMGIWFVALGFGGQFAGVLAKLASVPANVTEPAAQILFYRGAFFEFAYLAFGVTVFLIIVQFCLRKTLSTD